MNDINSELRQNIRIALTYFKQLEQDGKVRGVTTALRKCNDERTLQNLVSGLMPSVSYITDAGNTRLAALGLALADVLTMVDSSKGHAVTFMIQDTSKRCKWYDKARRSEDYFRDYNVINELLYYALPRVKLFDTLDSCHVVMKVKDEPPKFVSMAHNEDAYDDDAYFDDADFFERLDEVGDSDAED